MELLRGVAAAWHRRAGEELERGLVLYCSEEGPVFPVVARELTGAGVDPQAPIRPGLIGRIKRPGQEAVLKGQSEAL